MQTILIASPDDLGNVWLDSATPIEVMTEKEVPHRIALKTGADGANTASGRATVWLRVDRSNAYRLLEDLTQALTSLVAEGTERIEKRTVVKTPLNGGVNSNTGNMELLFEGQAGLHVKLELPHDESGYTLEILEQASKAAAKWADTKGYSPPGEMSECELHPREITSLTLAKDANSGKQMLVARLTTGHQFSFIIDRKIVETLRFQEPKRSVWEHGSPVPYWTVAEDLEWLRREWCVMWEPPRDDELRRGSAALRRLLVENLLQLAWKHYGFKRSPQVIAPDCRQLLAHQGIEQRHVLHLVVGGGLANGIQSAMIGGAKVFNRATGKGPDEPVGFAVQVGAILRDAREDDSLQETLSHLINTVTDLDSYKLGTSAIRNGIAISRQDVIKYFAIYRGGVHLEKDKPSRRDLEVYEFVAGLEGKIKADIIDGLHFELLSIGQAIGASADLQALTARIQAAAADAAKNQDSSPPFQTGINITSQTERPG